MPYRYALNPQAQIQIPVMVRFSSHAIMLRSQLQYRGELTAATATEEYNLAAVKAAKRAQDNKQRPPPLEPVHEVLQAAELELEAADDAIYEHARVPHFLKGKWKRAWESVMSEKSWASAKVCISL
jgi:hypothetical protein